MRYTVYIVYIRYTVYSDTSYTLYIPIHPPSVGSLFVSDAIIPRTTVDSSRANCGGTAGEFGAQSASGEPILHTSLQVQHMGFTRSTSELDLVDYQPGLLISSTEPLPAVAPPPDTAFS